MKGSYVLSLFLACSCTIRIGALGNMDFHEGFYAYIGSALNSLESRIARHVRYQKKIHWHIDYLLCHSEIESIYIKESSEREECSIADTFSVFGKGIHKFGCSDCSCHSHLFYFTEKDTIDSITRDLGMVRYNGTMLR